MKALIFMLLLAPPLAFAGEKLRNIVFLLVDDLGVVQADRVGGDGAKSFLTFAGFRRLSMRSSFTP